LIREYLSPGARQKNISANYLSIGTFENKKVGYMFEVKTFRQNLMTCPPKTDPFAVLGFGSKT